MSENKYKKEIQTIIDIYKDSKNMTLSTLQSSFGKAKTKNLERAKIACYQCHDELIIKQR